MADQAPLEVELKLMSAFLPTGREMVMRGALLAGFWVVYTFGVSAQRMRIRSSLESLENSLTVGPSEPSQAAEPAPPDEGLVPFKIGPEGFPFPWSNAASVDDRVALASRVMNLRLFLLAAICSLRRGRAAVWSIAKTVSAKAISEGSIAGALVNSRCLK